MDMDHCSSIVNFLSLSNDTSICSSFNEKIAVHDLKASIF